MNLLWILTAIVIGILHSFYILELFENDRHFSHLSKLERELSFRSEMGLYYSYFKTLAHAKTFALGLKALINDNTTEYPENINAIKRFNIYPEIVVGALFRLSKQIFKMCIPKFNLYQCWYISRGEYPDVKSCIGIGVPIYFYVYSVIFMSGITLFSLFLLGCIISHSMIGGFITTCSYFFNHSEATRVMWTIPLRESFGYPLFVLQCLFVTKIIREFRTPMRAIDCIAMFFVNTAFLLSWQFAPFILFVQLFCLYSVYILANSKDSPPFRKTLLNITYCHLASFGVSWMFLFFNPSLITSLYFCSIIILQVLLHGSRYIKGVFTKKPTHPFSTQMIYKTLNLIIYISLVLCLKLILNAILQYQDDNHVYEILKSKFTNYKNFHTMLYTCSAEFDFLSYKTYKKLSKTLLLPTAALVLILTLVQVFLYIKKPASGSSKLHKSGNGQALDSNTKTIIPNSSDYFPFLSEVYFTVNQAVVFFVLSVLIMRLKLFGTPHLCLLASLISNPLIFKEIMPCFQIKFFRMTKSEHYGRWWLYTLSVALIGLMSHQGIKNIQVERSHMGEYMNINQESMMNWIKANTQKDEAFAGPMAIMANIKLSTGRPIVNHPHYEDVNLRTKTKRIYTLFSRKPLREIHEILRNLSVTYAVVEDNWCFYQSSDKCTLPAIWDMEDAKNRNKIPACALLRYKNHKSKYFTTVYENSECTIVRVKPNVKPRNSNTIVP